MARQFYVQNLNNKKVSTKKTNGQQIKRVSNSVVRGGGRPDENDLTPANLTDTKETTQRFNFNNERGSLPVPTQKQRMSNVNLKKEPAEKSPTSFNLSQSQIEEN